MKFLAVLIARFSRQAPDAPDAFETRLKSLTSEKKGQRNLRPAQHQDHPILFRRAGHA
jgi:hypothetical protein